MGNFESIYDVLSDIDIDCAAMAYDGVKLWALERARFALNTRTNVVDVKLYGVRGAPHYERYSFLYLVAVTQNLNGRLSKAAVEV